MIMNITQLIKNLLGTDYIIGTNLFAGYREETSPDECLLVAETAGGATVEGPGFADRIDKDIQIISRAEDYFTARDGAWLAFNALHDTYGWNLPIVETGDPNWFVTSIGALTDPQYIGQDEKGLFEFSVNFIFRMEQNSCSE